MSGCLSSIGPCHFYQTHGHQCDICAESTRRGEEIQKARELDRAKRVLEHLGWTLIPPPPVKLGSLKPFQQYYLEVAPVVELLAEKARVPSDADADPHADVLRGVLRRVEMLKSVLMVTGVPAAVVDAMLDDPGEEA